MIQRILTVLAVIALALLSTPQSSFAESMDDGARKAILVTGASSGIGLNIAETLAAKRKFSIALRSGFNPDRWPV